MSTTSLKLSKQNIKFSAAHFLIFDAQRAERLHGHNYQVILEVFTSDAVKNNSLGFLIDFHDIKKVTKKIVDEWDEKTLLPANNKEFKFTQEGQSLKVEFRDRLYMFPRNELELLPIVNTSVEQLSELLGKKLLAELKSLGVIKLLVTVEETPGQGATTEVAV